MDTAARRLRIANRMCLLLQRELGVTVDVARVLRHRDEAAEVLFAARGLATPELLTLANQFEADTASLEAERLTAIAARVPGSATQDMSWSQASTGFGLDSSPFENLDTTEHARGLLARLFARTPSVAH